SDGHSAVGLGAQHVVVADVGGGDEVAARLQGAREQGEDLGEHLTREVEQGPPAQHPAEGRLTEVEIGRGGDVETALRVQPAGVLDHAGGEVHPGHVQPAFGEVGGDGPGSAADVEDRAEVPHGVGE